MTRKPIKRVRPVGQARLIDPQRMRRSGRTDHGVGLDVNRNRQTYVNTEALDMTENPQFQALKAENEAMKIALKNAGVI